MECGSIPEGTGSYIALKILIVVQYINIKRKGDTWFIFYKCCKILDNIAHPGVWEADGIGSS